MRKCHFGYLVAIVGGLGCPVLEAGPKPVDSCGEAEAPLQYEEKCVVGKRLSCELFGKDELGIG